MRMTIGRTTCEIRTSSNEPASHKELPVFDEAGPAPRRNGPELVASVADPTEPIVFEPRADAELAPM